MDTSEIRRLYLEYFVRQGHQLVESASLVPDKDPSLLFTNSGMVQFKEALALRENRGYTRAVSCQRCIRAGGKHNDLDRVGYTARHLTFFEMLGNFSFGDYFKREAIQFAWEFLTQELSIPPEKLWVTIHESDDEAADIWLNEQGVSPERFSRMGDRDNFWTMGDTGPSGPCSEIFFDHGAAVPGGPPGSAEDDLDRYVEIWNLVFTQYDRSADGSLTPLPKPCVDTGMGLERVAAALQGVESNYDTDILRHLVTSAARAIGVAETGQTSLRVLADHIRSAAFLIADGVLPSSEGRGYVLRRIIRRALRHGYMLEAEGSFFHKLVQPLAEIMGDAYPLLGKTAGQTRQILLKEEEQFALTLSTGMKILQEAMRDMEGGEVPGDLVFRLYDTYGFPADLTRDIAREQGKTLDMPGFESAMQAQKNRARAASRFGPAEEMQLAVSGVTEFSGYTGLTDSGRLLGLYQDQGQVQQLAAGETGWLVLDKTPFYAESGGQVGDRGRVCSAKGEARILDTVRQGDIHLHRAEVLEGCLSRGDTLEARVDAAKRRATVLNHSATHLMHAALREVLGDHVQQRGSLVNEHRLRFDFSHFAPVSSEQLQHIERLVNQQIRNNSEVCIETMPIAEAKSRGAIALFGEKYTAEVRVLTMGDGFSVELCGGTHASRTGDLGLFKIVSEQGTAGGVRRIEAVSGEAALGMFEQSEELLGDLTRLLKTDRSQLAARVKALAAEAKEAEKHLQEATRKLAMQAGGAAAGPVEVRGVKLLIRQLEGASPKLLPDMLDRLKNELGSGVVVLSTVQDDKVSLIAGVTKDLTERISAAELINEVAGQLGGRGGGRPDMARAGGAGSEKLPAALKTVQPWLEARL